MTVNTIIDATIDLRVSPYAVQGAKAELRGEGRRSDTEVLSGLELMVELDLLQLT